MTQLFSNNASGTLSVEMTVEAGPSAVTLQSSEGDLFPIVTSPDFMMVTVEDTGGNYEILKCTARADTSDVLTCERGQEGTTIQAFATGSRVELRTTAETLDQFIQKSGDQMEGELDMNDNVLRDPLITDGEIRNTPIRGTDGGTDNELLVPTAGGAPTIGGDTILHTGNDDAYVQTTRTLTGGEGISALGDLSADRTVSLNIPELTTISGTLIDGDDSFLVRDTSSSSHKRIPYQQAGLPIRTESTQLISPTDAEMNNMFLCTHSAADIDFELDAGVGEKGNVVLVQQSNATRTVTIGGTATINSAHAGPTTRTQFSVLIAICTAPDVWTVYGDGV